MCTLFESIIMETLGLLYTHILRERMVYLFMKDFNFSIIYLKFTYFQFGNKTDTYLHKTWVLIFASAPLSFLFLHFDLFF